MVHRLPKRESFKDLRNRILSRDRLTCQMCGSRPGDRSECDGKVLGISVGLLVPVKEGGNFSEPNLRAICADCAEGLDIACYTNRLLQNRVIFA
jgi:hypothetical protein